MKCHLIDRNVTVDQYPDSPHVRDRIERNEFPMCRQQTGINSSFTDDIHQVTCGGCLSISREARIKTLEKELAHWKANHEDLKNRLSFLSQRPDLDVTRIPVYESMKSQIDNLTVKWSIEPPPVAGWYWLRFGDRQDIIEYSQEVIDQLTTARQSEGWDRLRLIGNIAWAGPISSPTNSHEKEN